MKLLLEEDTSLEETIIDVTYKVYDRKLQKLIDLVQESVDNLTFLYTGELVYESREKLYFFEEQLINTSFLRISKSTILNMDYLKSVSVMPNYKLEALLSNSEKLVINRHYTKNIKDYLNI